MVEAKKIELWIKHENNRYHLWRQRHSFWGQLHKTELLWNAEPEEEKIKPYNDPLTQPLHRFPQDVSIVFSIKVAGWFQSGLV